MSRWSIIADPDAPLGPLSLMVELMTPNGPLKAELAVEVVTPTEANQNTTSTEPETGPEVRWVGKDE